MQQETHQFEGLHFPAIRRLRDLAESVRLEPGHMPAVFEVTEARGIDEIQDAGIEHLTQWDCITAGVGCLQLAGRPARGKARTRLEGNRLSAAKARFHSLG